MKQAGIVGLQREAIAAVDEDFAETVRFSFMSGGTADPSRPQREVDAVLRVNASAAIALNGGGIDFRSRFIVAGGEVHIDHAKYSDLVVRVDDRVRAVTRRGQPLFVVAAVDARNAGRLVLQVGKV